MCSCLPNVIGDKCDACQPEHYGLKTGEITNDLARQMLKSVHVLTADVFFCDH